MTTDPMEDAVVVEVNRSLIQTAIRSLRKIQTKVEAENRDLEISVSVFALRGDDGDIRVVLDGHVFSEINLWSNDSPRSWMRTIRRAIGDGRRQLELLKCQPSDN